MTRVNILSFDIESWFLSYESSQIDISQWSQMESRIENNLDIILRFLSTNNTNGTFYVLGWIVEQYPEVIKRIADEGHEIGYHSYYHQLPEMQGPLEFEKDLAKGLELLQKITGKKIVQYRAPRFSFNQNNGWCIPILLKHGITISSSSKSLRKIGSEKIPQTPFYFEYKAKKILELPLNQVSSVGLKWVYTGSGYFRVLPFRLIDHLYKKHEYNMAYFHPRDFDTAVPMTSKLPFYRNIMGRLGNSTTIPKLSNLMASQKFIPVGEAAGYYLEKSEELPIIKLG